MIPQLVHTMRGPNAGTGVLSGHGSALRIARWWHSQHDTSSDRTPWARMLPSVIGSIGSLKRGLVIANATPPPLVSISSAPGDVSAVPCLCALDSRRAVACVGRESVPD